MAKRKKASIVGGDLDDMKAELKFAYFVEMYISLHENLTAFRGKRATVEWARRWSETNGLRRKAGR